MLSFLLVLQQINYLYVNSLLFNLSIIVLNNYQSTIFSFYYILSEFLQGIASSVSLQKKGETKGDYLYLKYK